MNIKDIKAKVDAQEDPSIGLVVDGVINYLVLNKDDNKMDFDFIAKVNKILDQVEQTTGPAVLVTIGTGKKKFSTGFDLQFWGESSMNMFGSISQF